MIFEVEQLARVVANKFQKAYTGYFQLQTAYIWQQKIMYGLETSCRVDLVLRFKVLKPCGGKACNFWSFARREESSNRFRDQVTKYKMDCAWSGYSRWQWVHKEEREFHGPTDARSYSIPVTPICVNDFAETSITLISLMGCVELESI